MITNKLLCYLIKLLGVTPGFISLATSARVLQLGDYLSKQLYFIICFKKIIRDEFNKQLHFLNALSTLPELKVHRSGASTNDFQLAVKYQGQLQQESRKRCTSKELSKLSLKPNTPANAGKIAIIAKKIEPGKVIRDIIVSI